MRALLALLLAGLTLAGCVSPAADVDPASDGGLLPEGFAPPVAMTQPTGGAEPNVAVAPDGTLWITAVAGSQERPNHEQGAAWLWRSTDDGATWETLRAPQRDTPLGSVPGTRRPFGSSDADVVASADGWIYYSDWWNWGSPVCPPVGGGLVPLPASPCSRYGSYLVERSSDGGNTWESASVTTLDSVGGMDRQWLVAGPDGFVGLFYAYFHGPNPARAQGAADDLEGRSSIQAVYSRDHGATWTEPATVVETAPGESAFNQIGHPRVSPDGTLWMPHAWTKITDDYWHDPSEVRVAVSSDMGATWEVRKVADVPEGFDNLWAVQGDVDARGVMHVAWGARTGENMTVFHAMSADDGATWSEPIALSAGGLHFLPWVAATGDGDVAVAFYGSNATGVPDEAPEETEWFAWVARRQGDNGTFVLEKAQADPVKVGPMCPRGGDCQPALRDLLDYPSVAFGPDGALHVAYAVSRQVNGVNAGLVTYTRTLAG
ncbi:MAG TPA: sialidase family protein [Candidatus Thermoplasmatota archaeon]|nr:sialidase family protein [Candidatus Thermoplasmatota archaeon]